MPDCRWVLMCGMIAARLSSVFCRQTLSRGDAWMGVFAKENTFDELGQGIGPCDCPVSRNSLYSEAQHYVCRFTPRRARNCLHRRLATGRTNLGRRTVNQNGRIYICNHWRTSSLDGRSHCRNFVIRPSVSSYTNIVAADKSDAIGVSINIDESLAFIRPSTRNSKS